MAAILTIDYLKDLMREKDCKYFTVYDGNKVHRLGDQQDEECSLDASIDLLDKVLKAAAGSGFVVVDINNRNRQQTGKGGAIKSQKFTARVNVDQDTTPINKTPDITQNNQVFSLLEQIKELELKNQKIEYDYKFKELEAKIDAAKNSDPIEKYLPVIQGIFGQQNQTPSQPAQPIADQVGEDDEPIKARKKRVDEIAQVIRDLKELDPDFLTLLKSIVHLGKKDPTSFKVYTKQLKENYKNSKDAK